MKYAMRKVRKNGLSGATAIVTPLIFLMSLATRRFAVRFFAYKLKSFDISFCKLLQKLVTFYFNNQTSCTVIAGYVGRVA